MINRRFEEIGQEDIEELVERQIPEGRTLEYKAGIPPDTREFLADVSSFANASGGDILIGIEDERDTEQRATGRPAKIVGLGAVNIDAERQRLENACRDGITPRITGLRIKSIDGLDAGPVMLVRIPQSYAAPHMVGAVSRFYSRTSSGKYPLDVSELRAAFVASETLPERIARFREERIARIVAGETPNALQGDAFVALHIMPASARMSSVVRSLDSISRNDLPVLRTGPDNLRWNFEGLVAGSGRDGYTQLFRTGVVEAVNTSMLSRVIDDKPTVPSLALEVALVDGLEVFRNTLRKMEIDGPIVVFLSMVGVARHFLGVSPTRFLDSKAGPFARNNLLFPNSILEDEHSTAAALRPAFDMLWQAAGFQRCFDFDEQTGEFIRPAV